MLFNFNKRRMDTGLMIPEDEMFTSKDINLVIIKKTHLRYQFIYNSLFQTGF